MGVGRPPYTILVTGATGYLGSRLVAKLVGAHRVIAAVRTNSNLSRLEGLESQVKLLRVDEPSFSNELSSAKIDIIVHAATQYATAGVPESTVLESNFLWPQELVKMATGAGIPVFMNCDTSLDGLVNAYAAAKRQFATWLENTSPRLQVVNLVLEQFYGPGDNRFLSSFLSELQREAPEIELTPGEQVRDFIYVGDVVGAMHHIMDCLDKLEPSFESIAIGRGEKITLRERLIAVQEYSSNHSTRLAFGARDYRPAEAMYSVADASRLLELGFQPEVSFEVGIKKMLSYYGMRTNEDSH